MDQQNPQTSQTSQKGPEIDKTRAVVRTPQKVTRKKVTTDWDRLVTSPPTKEKPRNESTELMTVETLKAAFPGHLKTHATQKLADKINGLTTDPEEAVVFRDNLISYTSVLLEGKYRITDYVNAVVYVSHKLMGCSNQTAWKKTFPERHMRLVSEGRSEQDISAFVAAYNRNQLVNRVMEQSLIPTWILNADKYQTAINTQFELMTDPNVSPKVRTEAANSLLTHLKRPEAKKLEIDLGVRDNSGMTELKDMMTQLAEQQRELISAGMKTQEIAHQQLILNGVLEDIEDAEEAGEAGSSERD